MLASSRKILKGFFYVFGSGYLARLGSVGITVLITRELGPDVFAEVVVGVTIFTLLSSLREFGLLHALLHFQDRASEFLDTHFTLNLLITGLTCLLSSGIALCLVWLFPEQFSWMVALVIWIFSGLLFIRQLTLTSEGLLRMELAFGRLSLFHTFGTVLALLSALWAARAGWGKWSLIVGGWSTFSVFSVVYVLFFSTASWCSRPVKQWPLRLDRVWSRRLLQYGMWIWVGTILQTFILWYDRLIVKLTVGDLELSLYNHAVWLVQFPTAIITHMVFAYTNTLYSRYKEDTRRLSALFTRMMSLIVRVSWLLALIFILNSWELMNLMPQWLLAAPVVVWLSGYAFLRPLLDEGFGLLWAVGATRCSAKIVAVQAGIALVVVPALGLLLGVRGIAYAMGLVMAAGCIGLIFGVRQYVQIDWQSVFLRPLLATILAGGGGLFYSRWARGVALDDFLLRSSLIAGVYLSVLVLLEWKSIAAHILLVKQLVRDKVAEDPLVSPRDP